MSLIRRRIPLEDQIALDRLLDDAFAPARSRTVPPISSARIRARVAWDRGAAPSPRWRAVALLGRLGEASLALGLTAIVVAGSIGTVAPQTQSVQLKRGSEFPVRVTAPLDDSRFLRMLRLGRAAPILDDLDPTTALTPPVDDREPVITVREPQGLLH